MPNALTAVANMYDAAKHEPQNPDVQAAYAALVAGILEQYAELENAGIFVRFQEADPYANSKALRADVNENRTLRVFMGCDVPVDHPLARKVWVEDAPGKPVTLNHLFRAVHDYFGHVIGGNGFGVKGELAAARLHAEQMPKDALPALATETIGQLAWQYYGPHVASLPAGQREPFAEQKATLIPLDLFMAVLREEVPAAA